MTTTPSNSSPHSSSSISHSRSVRSTRNHPTINIVTTPPWARDEPPSPKEVVEAIPIAPLAVHQSRPSDIGSNYSDVGSGYETSRWWSFTIPRPREQPLVPPQPNPERAPKMSFRDRSMSWFPHNLNLKEGSSSGWRREKDSDAAALNPNRTDWNIGPLPPPQAPFTLAHTQTPGWETPWSARVPDGHDLEHSTSYGLGEQGPQDDDADHNKHLSSWQRKKKQFRLFVLSNTYVPLLFRFINITFTTASLGIAIKIRRLEGRYGVLGALGSSPMLVIIFAPPTLIHVFSAVYLEYFGRPLGLWRTSHKLAHTLFEVLFICMWSAALSLCFDNFFTSLVPCANSSQISWYSQLPRPQSPINASLDEVKDELCDDQLALICLTAVGLIMYCTNLVISLFRIFEKVKVHQTTLTGT